MARTSKMSLRYVVLVYATIALLLSRTVLTAAKTANGGVAGGASGSAGGVQKFAMEPQDQTAIVGSRVTLPCRVESKVGQLQWTKDDFGLGWHRNLSGFDRYSMVGSDEEGDYSLEIYPVMLDDEARYQCQVGRGKDGTPGIRSRFATLTVLVPPEPPKIVQGDFLVTTEDREIELECVSVGGKPAAEITWIDGLGNVLTSGIEYVKEPMTDTGRFTAKSILKLTPKKEHHNTSFTCQAQNTADRTYRSVKLKLEVKYAPKVSVSVIGGALSGGRIPEGAEVRLSCRADANPSEVTYKWYKADEPILGDYTTEMVIHNVSKAYHDAVIKCEVHNAVGKSEESEILDISYGPTFRTRPQSVETDIDRKVTLTCDVDGNPPPEIIWVHEDTSRIVSNSANITLMATRETAGNYYCKASVRGFPDIEASAAVHLKGPPTIRSPRQQYGSVNDNSQIQCDAISIPKAKQVIWTYNGLEVNSENDHTILENPSPEGVRSTLIISKSQRQHFGVYNCTVLNEYGSDTLEIQFAPMESSSLPVVILIVVVVFITIVFVLVVSLCCCERKGNKKLPPADVITDHYMTEKTCKESDRSSNVSDLKIDRDHEYSETCSGTDSIATRLAMNMMGSSSGGSNNSGGGGGGAPVNGGGGVPLAGPVRIPNDYRYSGDYSDGIGSTLQAKIGQSNGGYVPYVDYAQDYNLPMHISSNGQLPNGNLSLTRNRELRQDNGLPSIQNGMGSLSAGLMNTSLMNAPSIDPRYSATYGNPYLRSSSTHLPPLPPPSTANPALTPAPPPYSAGRHPASALLMGVNIGVNSGSVIGIGSSLTSPESLRSTSAGSEQPSAVQQQAQQQSAQVAGGQTGSPAPGQFILPANGDIRKGEFTATDKYYTNGGPKLRGWTNGGMQDHQSTLSRPRSAEVITANGNGTLPNGRHMNGVLTRGPGGLHEDLEFPPTPRTLSKKKQIVWMRPHDMCARPQFRIAPPGTPLTARELPEPVGPGDPSLLAALGCLSQLPRLLERVVPPEQTFDTANGYCGMFKFRFWQWGKWIEVRVDDRLPTRGDRPAHMHCAQPDIFWAALLEKAYAKLYGGYTFLKYGTVGRALQDLTGAVVQSVPPSGPLLGGAVPRSTLLIAISGLEKETKRRRSGLLTEHPYCVTGLARVRANSNDSVTHGSGSSGGDTSLIRLRSPWIGGEWGGVWCGAWSERSWEWNALNERDRELLSSRSSNDCEFWMSVNEFLTRFVVIWLAHIGPDDWALEPGLHTRAPWRAALAVRQWRAGFNAGGPHKFIETTATNPQFRIRVPPGHPSKAHVVVAVSQKYECYRSRNYEDEEIGFTIYEVPPGMQRVTPQYVSEQMPLDFAPLSNLREIATFFALPAGDFVVMPHAAQHREGRFLLRIFADQHTDVWEVNEENLVIHNIAAEFCDERTIDARILYKLRARYPHEIDATQLQAILKAHGGNNRGFRGLGGINCGPSLELCRGMLALRDPALGGRLSIEHVPALIGLMRFWKAAFRRCGPSSSGTATLSRGIWASKVSSYCLRGLLWAGGATASNKVLEALVSRFTRNRQITLEGYLLSMARLHLAHERYHSLDAKAKASPLSLEEMILMTIYS